MYSGGIRNLGWRGLILILSPSQIKGPNINLFYTQNQFCDTSITISDTGALVRCKSRDKNILIVIRIKITPSSYKAICAI